MALDLSLPLEHLVTRLLLSPTKVSGVLFSFAVSGFAGQTQQESSLDRQPREGHSGQRNQEVQKPKSVKSLVSSEKVTNN